MSSLFSLYFTNYDDWNRRIEPDEIDHEIATKRIEAYDNCDKPRVGDFVIMPDGKYERFSYAWNDGIQTCHEGSFYLGNGYASMSGSLNPCVPYEKLERTDKKKIGNFWFFHHDYHTSHNGIGVQIVCRVYRVI
jgi:hypothetical protein